MPGGRRNSEQHMNLSSRQSIDPKIHTTHTAHHTHTGEEMMVVIRGTIWREEW